MEIIKLRPQDEFIKLGQALKAAGLVESGVEAKDVIQNGLVLVNGEIDTRRGRKLYPGDIASFDGNEIKIEKNCAIINFSNEILNYKDENEKLKIINSIVNTLTNLKEINSIKILVNGSENENFSDEYLRTK